MPETEQDLPELPAIENGPDWVIMQHKVTGGIAEAHKDAFRDNWSEKGWIVVKVWSDPSLEDGSDEVPDEPPVPIHPEVELPPDEVADLDGDGSPPVLHPEV